MGQSTWGYYFLFFKNKDTFNKWNKNFTQVVTSRPSSSKPHKKSVPQAREFLQLMSPLEPLVRDLTASPLRILTQTDKPTENCFSPPPASRNTSVASSCSMRQSEILPQMVNKNSLDFRLLVELTKRPPPRDLTVLVRDAQNTMVWDADLQNGEQFSRSDKVCHLKPLSEKQLTPLLDTDPSANRTVLCQSLSQKFYRMELTILRFAPQYLREFSQQSCKSFSTSIYLLRDFCLSQTWSPQVPHAKRELSQKRSLGLP